MAHFEIPILTDSTSFRYTISLDGENFIFEFNYMQRHDAWYFSAFLPDGTGLITGVRIAEFWPLNLRDLDPRLFDGVLSAIRRDGKRGIDPTYEDFQTGAVRILLVTAEGLSLPASPSSPIVRVTA